MNATRRIVKRLLSIGVPYTTAAPLASNILVTTV